MLQNYIHNASMTKVRMLSALANLTDVGSCEAGWTKLDSSLCIFKSTFYIAKGQPDPAPVCIQCVLPLRQLKIYSLGICKLGCLQVPLSCLGIPLQP